MNLKIINNEIRASEIKYCETVKSSPFNIFVMRIIAMHQLRSW